jgi:hypothetical protein
MSCDINFFNMLTLNALYTYVWAHWHSTFHSNMEVVNDSNFFCDRFMRLTHHLFDKLLMNMRHILSLKTSERENHNFPFTNMLWEILLFWLNGMQK